MDINYYLLFGPWIVGVGFVAACSFIATLLDYKPSVGAKIGFILYAIASIFALGIVLIIMGINNI